MRYLKYNEEFSGINDPDLIKLVDDINKWPMNVLVN